MLLLGYFILLALVFLISRRWKAKHRTILILGYNFLFVLVAQYIVRVMASDTFVTSIGKSLYNTVQDLTFDGDMDWADQAPTEWLKAQIWLVVFLAGFFNVRSVLLTFFYRFFAQANLRVKVRLSKNQSIFVGKISDAQELVADTTKSIIKPRIIYIPTETLPVGSELYKICRIEKESYLNHLKRRKNYTVVLLPDDEYVNLERVHSLNEWVGKNKKKVGSVRVSVFLDNNLERFHDFRADNLDTCVISKEEIAVRSFFEECPPIEILEKTNSFEQNGLPYLTDPFKMCVIGFGSIGQEFLLLSYENSAFPTRNGDSGFFKALVIDDKLDSKKAAFLTEAPHFADSKEIAFVKAEYNSDLYFEAVKKYATDWKQIVVSTDDTKANIDIAMKLCRIYDGLGMIESRPQITVVFHDSFAGAKSLLDKSPNVKVVDVESRLINYKTLVDRSTDLIAIDANRHYNQVSNRGTYWNNLGTFLEASNRALALDIPIKQRLFKMSRASQTQTLEFLARYEHNRWMAFSFAHGWMPLPASELTEQERANFITKRKLEKRHACLVPWEELDSLPQETPGKIKSYDVENVRHALGDVSKI